MTRDYPVPNVDLLTAYAGLGMSIGAIRPDARDPSVFLSGYRWDPADPRVTVQAQPIATGSGWFLWARRTIAGVHFDTLTPGDWYGCAHAPVEA